MLSWQELIQRVSGENKMRVLRKLAKCDRGATAIEYGLIAALIAVAIIAAVRLTGTSLTTTFNTIATSLAGA